MVLMKKKDFLDRLDEMVEQAFDDQCIGVIPFFINERNQRYMYLEAYYGGER